MSKLYKYVPLVMAVFGWCWAFVEFVAGNPFDAAVTFWLSFFAWYQWQDTKELV